MSPRKVIACMGEVRFQSAQLYVDPDGSAFRALGGHRLPTTYVVDARGVARRIHHGSGPGHEARLERWLTKMVGRPQPASR